jgi:hypothetical protein
MSVSAPFVLWVGIDFVPNKKLPKKDSREFVNRINTAATRFSGPCEQSPPGHAVPPPGHSHDNQNHEKKSALQKNSNF